MSYRIFLTGAGIASEAREMLRQHGCVVDGGSPEDTVSDLVRQVGELDPHGLIVRQGKITREVQKAAPSLRVICKHGVGVDNIDVEAASERGVPVLFTPDANFESAAEHTLALILALARQIPREDRRIRGGVFDKRRYGGLELRGKTLGLIGFGRIGRRVAQLVEPFGMPVLVYHPSATDEPLPGFITKVKAVREVLRDADVVSLHCPLTPETRGLINERTIGLMKEGAFVVNTSRGGVVEEADLVAAIRSGRIAGAGLDVFQEEPLSPNHPLLELDTVVVTTHVAGVSDASFRNMGLEAVNHVLSVLESREVNRRALLNPTVLAPGVHDGALGRAPARG